MKTTRYVPAGTPVGTSKSALIDCPARSVRASVLHDAPAVGHSNAVIYLRSTWRSRRRWQRLYSSVSPDVFRMVASPVFPAVIGLAVGRDLDCPGRPATAEEATAPAN